MNKQRRDILKKAKGLIDSVETMVEGVLDSEQDSMDNMPENLQYSDRYDKMDKAVRNLEDFLRELDGLRGYLEEACT